MPTKTVRSTKFDIRKLEMKVIIGATVFVFGGLFYLLLSPVSGWSTVVAALYPAGAVIATFVRVCSKTLRREKFDATDMVGFWTAALGMLGGAIGLFAVIYRQFGLLNGNAEIHDPWTCFYFSVITWTTVGYGDFVPSARSRPFAALEAMTGYIFMALLTAAIVQIVTRYNPPVPVSGADQIDSNVDRP